MAKKTASIAIKKNEIEFGITSESDSTQPNPVELYLGAVAACILKNVERFSSLMRFTYSEADVIVKAKRNGSPPKITDIAYELTLYSNELDLNVDLLQRNIENHGTIYNSVQQSGKIKGVLRVLEPKALSKMKD